MADSETLDNGVTITRKPYTLRELAELVAAGNTDPDTLAARAAETLMAEDMANVGFARTSDEIAEETGEPLFYVTFLCRGDQLDSIEKWREQIGTGEASITNHERVES